MKSLPIFLILMMSLPILWGCSREKPPPATDEDIVRAVKVLLEINRAIDETKINVSCKDGVVLLTGTVRSKKEKKLAEKEAKKIHEVKKVENKLIVVPSPSKGRR
jgi:osmotically-inducible protein OsmY